MNRIGLTILSSFQNYNNKMGLGSLTLIIFKRAPCLQINLNCLTDVRSTKRVSFWTFNWATERRVLSGVFYWVDVALVPLSSGCCPHLSVSPLPHSHHLRFILQHKIYQNQSDEQQCCVTPAAAAVVAVLWNGRPGLMAPHYYYLSWTRQGAVPSNRVSRGWCPRVLE